MLALVFQLVAASAGIQGQVASDCRRGKCDILAVQKGRVGRIDQWLDRDLDLGQYAADAQHLIPQTEAPISDLRSRRGWRVVASVYFEHDNDEIRMKVRFFGPDGKLRLTGEGLYFLLEAEIGNLFGGSDEIFAITSNEEHAYNVLTEICFLPERGSPKILIENQGTFEKFLGKSCGRGARRHDGPPDIRRCERGHKGPDPRVLRLGPQNEITDASGGVVAARSNGGNRIALLEYTMNLKSLFGILAACIAGFLGGTFASQNRVEAFSPTVVRASKFELLNGAGVPVGSWEVDSNNEIHLRLLPRQEHAAFDIGILGDGRPIFRMSGRDGKDRVVIELDQADKPILGMGDERWEGRVLLGFNGPDFPDSNWDNWGLRFHTFGSNKTVSGIGTTQKKGGPVKGFLTVSGKRIR
jgi:hypothetical protein